MGRYSHPKFVCGFSFFFLGYYFLILIINGEKEWNGGRRGLTWEHVEGVGVNWHE